MDCHLKFGALYHTNLSPFSVENCFKMLSARKSGKFQIHLKFGALYHTNLSPFSVENCFKMLSARKSGKFQMANHIDYDREENKIELILDYQGNVISTLVTTSGMLVGTLRNHVFEITY